MRSRVVIGSEAHQRKSIAGKVKSQKSPEVNGTGPLLAGHDQNVNSNAEVFIEHL